MWRSSNGHVLALDAVGAGRSTSSHPVAGNAAVPISRIRRVKFARSLKQLIETAEELEGRGIGFRSLTEASDTTPPGGRFVFQLFGALAEFERNVIRERTRAGLDAARARGKKGGRPPKLNADDLKAAKALLADPEINIEEVARRLGGSSATLYRHMPAPRVTYGQAH